MDSSFHRRFRRERGFRIGVVVGLMLLSVALAYQPAGTGVSFWFLLCGLPLILVSDWADGLRPEFIRTVRVYGGGWWWLLWAWCAVTLAALPCLALAWLPPGRSLWHVAVVIMPAILLGLLVRTLWDRLEPRRMSEHYRLKDGLGEMAET